MFFARMCVILFIYYFFFGGGGLHFVFQFPCSLLGTSVQLAHALTLTSKTTQVGINSMDAKTLKQCHSPLQKKINPTFCEAFANISDTIHVEQIRLDQNIPLRYYFFFA